MNAFNWYDVLALVPLIGILVFETRQEFGRGLLDTLAAAFAFYIAHRCYPVVADALRLSSDYWANSAIAFGSLFVFLLAIGLLTSRALNRQFRMSYDQYDPAFGAVFGLALALVVGHGFTTTLWEYHGGSAPRYLAESRVADELASFRALKNAAGEVHHAMLDSVERP